MERWRLERVVAAEQGKKVLILFDHSCGLPGPPHHENCKPGVAGDTQSSDAVLSTKANGNGSELKLL